METRFFFSLTWSVAFLMLLVIGSTESAFAQEVVTAKRLNFERVQGKLPNGFRYLVEHRAGEPVVIRLVIRTGNFVERPQEAGLSHLIEHRAFTRTEHFETGRLKRLLKYKFDGTIMGVTTPYDTRLGMTLGASTDRDVPELINILRDWARGISLDKSALAKEGRIQLDEWRGASRYGAERQILDRVLGTHSKSYENRVIKNLHDFSPKVAKKYYDLWYRPSLMAIVVVGDVDPLVWEANITKVLSGLRDPAEVAAPYMPRPQSIPHGERIFAISDASSSPLTVRTFTLSAASREDRPVKSQRDGLVADLARSIINRRAEVVGGNDVAIDAGDGMTDLIPGIHTGMKLISHPTFSNLSQTVAAHDALVQNLRDTKIDTREFRDSKNSLREFISLIPDHSTMIADYFSGFFAIGEQPPLYINNDNKLNLLDQISVTEVQQAVDRLTVGRPRTGISAPPSLMKKIDAAKLLAEIGGYKTSESVAVEPMPVSEQVIESPVSINTAPRARLPILATYQSLLPNGLRLTMADPDIVKTSATILKILGDCDGVEHVEDRNIVFDLSDKRKSSTSLNQGIRSSLIQGKVSCINGLFSLTLVTNSNMTIEIFELASFIVQDHSIIRWDNQRSTSSGLMSDEQQTFAKPSSNFEWKPRRLLFVGGRRPDEIEEIAWKSFVTSRSSQVQTSVCDIEANGSRVISSSLLQSSDDRKITSTLEIRVPLIEFSSACWDIFRDMLADQLYYDLRLEKAVAYNPRFQFSSKNDGQIQRLQFAFAVERDDINGPEKLAAWKVFISNLAGHLSKRDQFEVSRLAITRRRLAPPTSASQIAAFLQDTLIGLRDDSSDDPFGAELVTFEDLSAMVRQVANGLASGRKMSNGRR